MLWEWQSLSQPDREKFLQLAVGAHATIDPPRLESAAARHNTNNGSFGLILPRTSACISYAQPKSKRKGKSKARCATKKRKDYIEEESDEDDWEQMAQTQVLPRISFRVSDGENIEAFIYTRFMQIQQSALKVIAKAWIKAICPKKQANFPYVDSNPRHDQPRRRPRHAGPPRVPMFWPDLGVCRHREPDHLDKNGNTSYPIQACIG